MLTNILAVYYSDTPRNCFMPELFLQKKSSTDRIFVFMCLIDIFLPALALLLSSPYGSQPLWMCLLSVITTSNRRIEMSNAKRNKTKKSDGIFLKKNK